MFGLLGLHQYLCQHGSLDLEHQWQTGWMQGALGKQTDHAKKILQGRTCQPSAALLRGDPEEWDPRPSLQPVFLSPPPPDCLPCLPLFILGFEKIPVVIQLAAVAPRARSGAEVGWGKKYMVLIRSEFRFLARSQNFHNLLEFVQAKYQITLRFTFCVESCTKNLLMFAASDSTVAGEGQEENLLISPVDL